MRLVGLGISQFRSIETLDLRFPRYYTAISGKNNAGKTNVVGAITRILMNRDEIEISNIFDLVVTGGFFDTRSDVPAWLPEGAEEATSLSLDLKVSPKADPGILKYIKQFIIEKADEFDPKDERERDLKITWARGKKKKAATTATFDGEKLDDYKAEELLKKLRSLAPIRYHNSVESNRRGSYAEVFRAFSSATGDENRDAVVRKTEALKRAIRTAMSSHKKGLAQLLSRLQEKLDVELSLPDTIRLENIPVDVMLGDSKSPVRLDDWGSGTRNRTLILANLLNAKRRGEKGDAVTPILIVEEPESFLHPSAQADFGRVLQNLAEEQQVQVIVTTHSPYLLSHQEPEANILLERAASKGKKHKATTRIEVNHEKWTKPFELALGIHTPDMYGLKGAFFSSDECITLVEGETDREYLRLLREDHHKGNRLTVPGDIFPYGGVDNLSNALLLRFIRDRFRSFIVTVDLDRVSDLKRAFSDLGMVEGDHYVAVGVAKPGKKSIEGLLPERVVNAVHASNTELVQAALENSKEAKSARSQLKKLYLAEFKSTAQPGNGDFDGFYGLAKKLNHAHKRQAG